MFITLCWYFQCHCLNLSDLTCLAGMDDHTNLQCRSVLLIKLVPRVVLGRRPTTWHRVPNITNTCIFKLQRRRTLHEKSGLSHRTLLRISIVGVWMTVISWSAHQWQRESGWESTLHEQSTWTPCVSTSNRGTLDRSVSNIICRNDIMCSRTCLFSKCQILSYAAMLLNLTQIVFEYHEF